MQTGTDHAQTAGNLCAAAADVHFTGNVVKVDPLAFGGSDNALCTQNDAVGNCIGKLGEDIADLLFGILMCSLCAEGDKDFVGVVAVVMMLVIMVIVTAGAGAILMMVVLSPSS